MTRENEMMKKCNLQLYFFLSLSLSLSLVRLKHVRASTYLEIPPPTPTTYLLVFGLYMRFSSRGLLFYSLSFISIKKNFFFGSSNYLFYIFFTII